MGFAIGMELRKAIAKAEKEKEQDGTKTNNGEEQGILSE
jgi:hypothetical protein